MIVATAAFGMGVSRGDIRYVYRLGYADSLEMLAQQVGNNYRQIRT